jgi:two-component system sensor kinase FixL
MENLSEAGKNYLARMQSAAARMQELISSLLHFSRLSSENEKFQPVNLTNILFQVLDDLQVAIENSKAQFEIDELPVIEGSSYQLAQLFQNLIANAIKFRKKDVSPLIKITCHKKMDTILLEEMIEIQIEDNGMGFNEKYSQKIFEPFQQIEGKKYGGSGIGLATCKKITLKHGGDIIAKSEEGNGARFTITLKTKHH